MEPCKGRNCGCTDGLNHSDECKLEHEAACLGAWISWEAPAAHATGLLALARYGATVIRACIGRSEPLTMDDVVALGWQSGICEGSSGRLMVPGVHEAIAALLAPDGAGDGEVSGG